MTRIYNTPFKKKNDDFISYRIGKIFDLSGGMQLEGIYIILTTRTHWQYIYFKLSEFEIKSRLLHFVLSHKQSIIDFMRLNELV